MFLLLTPSKPAGVADERVAFLQLTAISAASLENLTNVSITPRGRMAVAVLRDSLHGCPRDPHHDEQVRPRAFHARSGNPDIQFPGPQ